MIKLTKRQREILTRMRDEDEEIAAEGLICYLDTDRISRRTLNFFIQHILVSEVPYPGSIYWRINESGKRVLDGLPPYRLHDGKYVDDWRQAN